MRVTEMPDLICATCRKNNNEIKLTPFAINKNLTIFMCSMPNCLYPLNTKKLHRFVFKRCPSASSEEELQLCEPSEVPGIKNLLALLIRKQNSSSESQPQSPSPSQEITSSASQEVVTNSASQEVTSSASQEVTSSASQEVTSSASQEVTSSVSQEVTNSASQEVNSASQEVTGSEPVPEEKEEITVELVVSPSDESKPILQEKVPSHGGSCKSTFCESNEVSVFPVWENKDASCWLDSTLCLLVHSKKLKTYFKSEHFDQCQIKDISLAYDEAVSILNSENSQKRSMRIAFSNLEKVREKTFDFLQPYMGCERGQEESPIFAIMNLLRENEQLNRLFLQKFSLELHCTSCGYKKISHNRKNIVTIPSIHQDFSGSQLHYFRPCFQCETPGQKITLKFLHLPPLLLMHFVEGLPHNEIASFDLLHAEKTYRVRGFVQYGERNRHFVAWIRNDTGDWMCCDDLNLPLQTFKSKLPNIPAAEIHIVMWEQQETASDEDDLRLRISDTEDCTDSHSSSVESAEPPLIVLDDSDSEAEKLVQARLEESLHEAVVIVESPDIERSASHSKTFNGDHISSQDEKNKQELNPVDDSPEQQVANTQAASSLKQKEKLTVENKLDNNISCANEDSIQSNFISDCVPSSCEFSDEIARNREQSENLRNERLFEQNPKYHTEAKVPAINSDQKSDPIIYDTTVHSHCGEKDVNLGTVPANESGVCSTETHASCKKGMEGKLWQSHSQQSTEVTEQQQEIVQTQRAQHSEHNYSSVLSKNFPQCYVLADRLDVDLYIRKKLLDVDSHGGKASVGEDSLDQVIEETYDFQKVPLKFRKHRKGRKTPLSVEEQGCFDVDLQSADDAVAKSVLQTADGPIFNCSSAAKSHSVSSWPSVKSTTKQSEELVIASSPCNISEQSLGSSPKSKTGKLVIPGKLCTEMIKRYQSEISRNMAIEEREMKIDSFGSAAFGTRPKDEVLNVSNTDANINTVTSGDINQSVLNVTRKDLIAECKDIIKDTKNEKSNRLMRNSAPDKVQAMYDPNSSSIVPATGNCTSDVNTSKTPSTFTQLGPAKTLEHSDPKSPSKVGSSPVQPKTSQQIMGTGGNSELVSASQNCKSAVSMATEPKISENIESVCDESCMCDLCGVLKTIQFGCADLNAEEMSSSIQMSKEFEIGVEPDVDVSFSGSGTLVQERSEKILCSAPTEQRETLLSPEKPKYSATLCSNEGPHLKKGKSYARAVQKLQERKPIAANKKKLGRAPKNNKLSISVTKISEKRLSHVVDDKFQLPKHDDCTDQSCNKDPGVLEDSVVNVDDVCAKDSERTEIPCKEPDILDICDNSCNSKSGKDLRQSRNLQHTKNILQEKSQDRRLLPKTSINTCPFSQDSVGQKPAHLDTSSTHSLPSCKPKVEIKFEPDSVKFIEVPVDGQSSDTESMLYAECCVKRNGEICGKPEFPVHNDEKSQECLNVTLPCIGSNNQVTENLNKKQNGDTLSEALGKQCLRSNKKGNKSARAKSVAKEQVSSPSVTRSRKKNLPSSGTCSKKKKKVVRDVVKYKHITATFEFEADSSEEDVLQPSQTEAEFESSNVNSLHENSIDSSCYSFTDGSLHTYSKACNTQHAKGDNSSPHNFKIQDVEESDASQVIFDSVTLLKANLHSDSHEKHDSTTAVGEPSDSLTNSLVVSKELVPVQKVGKRGRKPKVVPEKLSTPLVPSARETSKQQRRKNSKRELLCDTSAPKQTEARNSGKNKVWAVLNSKFQGKQNQEKIKRGGSEKENKAAIESKDCNQIRTVVGHSPTRREGHEYSKGENLVQWKKYFNNVKKMILEHNESASEPGECQVTQNFCAPDEISVSELKTAGFSESKGKSAESVALMSQDLPGSQNSKRTRKRKCIKENVPDDIQDQKLSPHCQIQPHGVVKKGILSEKKKTKNVKTVRFNIGEPQDCITISSPEENEGNATPKRHSKICFPKALNFKNVETPDPSASPVHHGKRKKINPTVTASEPVAQVKRKKSNAPPQSPKEKIQPIKRRWLSDNFTSGDNELETSETEPQSLPSVGRPSISKKRDFLLKVNPFFKYTSEDLSLNLNFNNPIPRLQINNMVVCPPQENSSMEIR